MERKDVNLDLMILNPLMGWDKKDKTQELYREKIEDFERKCEKSLIETFDRLDIKGMTKTDPYSLPYTNEVVVKLPGESYLNGPYEFYRVARRVVKEILNKDLHRVRFYFYINVLDRKESGWMMGAVEYRFRYYVKK